MIGTVVFSDRDYSLLVYVCSSTGRERENVARKKRKREKESTVEDFHGRSFRPVVRKNERAQDGKNLGRRCSLSDADL